MVLLLYILFKILYIPLLIGGNSIVAESVNYFAEPMPQKNEADIVEC